MKKFLIVSVIFLLILSIFACKALFSIPDKDDPTKDIPLYVIKVNNKDKVSISWDIPEESTHTGFKVFYRQYGEDDWVLLSTVTEQYLEIHSSMIDYGVYEFAVNAYDSEGESLLHHSYDEDAFPEPWCLHWKK